MNDLQMKHCVANTGDIKRQNEKNLISERDVVVVEGKCGSDLSDCLSGEKEENEKNSAKEV